MEFDSMNVITVKNQENFKRALFTITDIIFWQFIVFP